MTEHQRPWPLIRILLQMAAAGLTWYVANHLLHEWLHHLPEPLPEVLSNESNYEMLIATGGGVAQ